ncbi:MAG: OB-fold nucleic acid binding domain-containing protein [Prevotella sp.]|nr:OB-fold nucleic acid binding domain-containing protein [Prevotella sp.]
MKNILYSIMALSTLALGFTACEDVPEPYGMPVVEDNGVGQGGGGTELELTSAGTATSPYIVPDIIAVAKQMTADDVKSGVYVKGIVSQIDEIDTGNYGNATYFISIDGTTTNQFEIYRGYYLDGAKFTAEDQLKVGDVVVVYGDLVNFKGNTPELTQRNKLISINDPNVNPAVGDGAEGGTDTPGGELVGTGTADSPYNVASILKVGAKLTADDQVEDVYVKGIVSEIQEVSTSFGNATYYISDDGKTDTQFMVYRGYYLNGDKFTAEDQIKLGDEVVVCGTLVNFKGNTLELTQGSKLISISNGGGETPEPTPGEATGDGTLESPFNAVAANNEAGKLAAGETSTDSYYIKGKISSIKYTFSAQYGTATFYISDDGGSSNTFYIYSTLFLENKSWVDGNTQIATGDEVIVYGQLTNYNGTLETASKKSYIYSLNGKTVDEGGSDTPDTPDNTTGGTLDGKVLTLTAAQLGVADKEKLSTVTLVDGTTLTFEGGGNNNVPVYYAAAPGAVRMYPKNSMTINAGSKTIASVKLVCNNYNNTLYNASGDVTLAGVQATVDGLELVFSGINASQATLTDVSQTTSAPSQLRWEQLVITYAE